MNLRKDKRVEHDDEWPKGPPAYQVKPKAPLRPAHERDTLVLQLTESIRMEAVLYDDHRATAYFYRRNRDTYVAGVMEPHRMATHRPAHPGLYLGTYLRHGYLCMYYWDGTDWYAASDSTIQCHFRFTKLDAETHAFGTRYFYALPRQVAKGLGVRL